jgi:putative intracellular protease/amidase
MLILPGGSAWEKRANPEAIEKAREFLDAGVPVAAICAATLALARAGFLDTRKHTSNLREYIALSGYHGSEHYLDQPAVTDGCLITASGIAPVDFAREIFKMLSVYSEPALDAWYALFKTCESARFFDLMRAAGIQA